MQHLPVPGFGIAGAWLRARPHPCLFPLCPWVCLPLCHLHALCTASPLRVPQCRPVCARPVVQCHAHSCVRAPRLASRHLCHRLCPPRALPAAALAAGIQAEAQAAAAAARTPAAAAVARAPAAGYPVYAAHTSHSAGTCTIPGEVGRLVDKADSRRRRDMAQAPGRSCCC